MPHDIPAGAAVVFYVGAIIGPRRRVLEDFPVWRPGDQIRRAVTDVSIELAKAVRVSVTRAIEIVISIK